MRGEEEQPCSLPCSSLQAAGGEYLPILQGWDVSHSGGVASPACGTILSGFCSVLVFASASAAAVEAGEAVSAGKCGPAVRACSGAAEPLFDEGVG